MAKFTEADIQNYMKEYGCTYAKAYSIVEKKSVGLPVEDFGGEGSGNFGHGGREGEVGGSDDTVGSSGKSKEIGQLGVITSDIKLDWMDDKIKKGEKVKIVGEDKGFDGERRLVVRTPGGEEFTVSENEVSGGKDM